MTREGTRRIAALIAAVLAAAILAACGGSNSDTSSAMNAGSNSATTTGTTAENGPPSNAPKKGGSRGQSNDQGQNGKQSQTSQGGGGSGPKNVATPLAVSGGGSKQFRTKGGDNSIQEYGGESGELELQEAAEVVHGFYVARAEEKWDTACSYLSKSNIEQLEQLAAQSSQPKGANCATVLKAFTRPLPAAVEREITTVDAGSLRREGEQGFLIYYGAGHLKYAMPLRDEGGTWKVTALSGTTLG